MKRQKLLLIVAAIALLLPTVAGWATAQTPDAMIATNVVDAVSTAGAPGAAPRPADPGASAITLLADADATLKSGYPNENFGGTDTLDLQYAYAGRTIERILLHFNLSAGLPSGAIIDSALLQVRLDSGTGVDPITARASTVTGDWGELSVTWDTAPGIDDPHADAQVGMTQAWTTWDVTAIARGWQSGRNYGLELRGPESGADWYRTFRSRHPGEAEPQLVISYHLTQVDTPTPTPTSTRTRTPTPSATATATPTGTHTPTSTIGPSPYLRDAWVDIEAASSNHGADTALEVSLVPRISPKLPDLERRALLRFAVNVPAGVYVKNATLELYAQQVTDPGPAQYALSAWRMLGPWEEMGVTWNNMPGWTEIGGAVQNVPVAVGWVSWNVTNIAREWAWEPAENYGLVIAHGGTTQGHRRFHSREASYRPRLTLTTTTEDNDLPTNPIKVAGDRPINTWSNAAAITMNWAGANDATSGVHGYSTLWATSFTLPDQVEDTRDLSLQTTIPGEGKSWYFMVRAVDGAGNWAAGAAWVGPFWLDTTPPTNPYLFYSNPPVQTWSNLNKVYMQWVGAADVGGSGVHGYAIAWSTNPSEQPPAVENVIGDFETTSPALADGEHYFHVRTRDWAGNWSSAAHRGPFQIDTVPPSSYATSVGEVSVTTTFPVTVVGQDATSGVSNVEVQVQTRPPGNGWWVWKDFLQPGTRTHTGVAGYTYCFRTRATDKAGNQQAWELEPDICVTVQSAGVKATGVEVNQGILSGLYQVNLTAGRTTLVRCHVQSSDSNTYYMAGRLRVLRGAGEELGVLMPIYNAQNLAVKPNPDRGNIRDSYAYVLPVEWTGVGQLQLQCLVNFPQTLSEKDYTDNTAVATVGFVAPPAPICAKFYPVRTLDGWPSALYMGTYDGYDILRRAETLLPTNIRAYYVPSLLERADVCLFLGVPYPCYRPYDPTNALHQSLILANLYVTDQLSSDPKACNDAGARTHYVGMLKPFAGSTNGMARTGIGGAATDQLWFVLRLGSPPYAAPLGQGPINNPRAGVTLAHELGHNYGLPHTDCGSPADPGAYPYGDACHFANAQYPNYGFDPISTSLIPYTAAVGDLMSYANFRWTSDYTWASIAGGLNAQAAQARAAAAGTQRSVNQATGDVLLAVGITASDATTATLTTVARLPATYMPAQKLDRLLAANRSAQAAAGGYRLELVGSGGQVLSAQTFTPDTPSDSPFALFGLTVPYAEGAREVRVMRDTDVLASRTISAHAPAVTVTSPNGREVAGETLTIRWDASDADGDLLTYTAQYSPDLGASWATLVTGYYTTTLTVSTQTLAGSDGTSLIRVTANDGVNTATDASDAPFSAPGHAPQVFIEVADGARFTPGMPIGLRGNAMDVEDSPLAGDTLRWTLDGGEVGRGEAMTLFDLPEGSHQVTLEATDSDGQRGSASISIRVALPPVVYLPIVLK